MKVAWFFLCGILVVGTGLESAAEESHLERAPFHTGGVAINEILADPPDGEAGDANRDGVRHTYADEFVELYNAGRDTIDLRSWQIADGISIRHTFPDSLDALLLPGEFVTVFGGGEPTGFGSGVWVASSGRLALNNSGDRVVLLSAHGDTVDVREYGAEAGRNESLIRVPDGLGEWTRPSQEGWDWFFSPHEANRGQTSTTRQSWGEIKRQYRAHG